MLISQHIIMQENVLIRIFNNNILWPFHIFQPCSQVLYKGKQISVHTKLTEWTQGMHTLGRMRVVADEGKWGGNAGGGKESQAANGHGHGIPISIWQLGASFHFLHKNAALSRELHSNQCAGSVPAQNRYENRQKGLLCTPSTYASDHCS